MAGFSAPAHLAAMLPLLAADGRPFSNGRSERTREALRKAEEEKAKVEREKWAKERLRPGVGDASLDETVFRRAEFWAKFSLTLS